MATALELDDATLISHQKWLFPNAADSLSNNTMQLSMLGRAH